MNNLDLDTLIKLVLAIGAVGFGFKIMPIRKNPIASGLILITVSILLLTTAEHSIGLNPIHLLGLLIGVSAGLSFPCCSIDSQYPKIIQLPAFMIMLGHSVLDGHIIQEAGSILLLISLFAHKILDGADTTILTGEDNSKTKYFARTLLILSTPAGLLFIPDSLNDSILNTLMFTLVIGFNFGTAFHMFRHASKIRSHTAHP